MTEMTLDTMDKRILDIIQTDFPLESRPYAIIAERLGITEQEALDRVNALRKSRLIRIRHHYADHAVLYQERRRHLRRH